MIRVTVELIPQGNEARARKVGVMEIANDGEGTVDLGNYTGVLHGEYTTGDGRRGQVLNFRRQRQSVWSLVGAFLKLWGHTSHSPKDLKADNPQPELGL